MKQRILFTLALLCAIAQGAWAWEGNGTKNNPWLIKTTADLDQIAESVNSGARTYAKKYFKLCNDLTYDDTKENNFTPIGGYYNLTDCTFSGYFDGCGHTISGIRIKSDNKQVGLFGRTGKSALIHDVILANSEILGSFHTGGIVGYQYGGKVQNCTVESTVTVGCTRYNAQNIGGIVGQNYGGEIEYCTSSVTIAPPFYGNISYNYGGICGYSVGILSWNLVVGATIPAISDGSHGAICGGQDAEWGRLYSNYYNACTVAGTANATKVGCHAADVSNDGAVSIVLSGNGTESKPYIIKSYTRWRIFACYVNNGNELSSKHWKLTANIKAETMAGRSETNSFQGVFDGNGHTLTVNYKSAVPGVAPFSYAKNATIKNLRVAGAIAASAQYAGGIVGQSYESLNLTGCCSSVTINSSVSGDGAHGGLVGMLNGTSNTISACVFDGSFATTNGTNGCGGFIGWGVYNKPTITNSLMKPGSVAANMLGSNFARWYTGDDGIYEPTIDNCYYVATDNLPADQGTEAYALATAPGNIGEATADYGMVKTYANGILFDGKYYVAPVTISLADRDNNATAISNADGYLANVTLSDHTLYKDGKWNTLCLPFSLVLEGSPLEGATARPLTSASISGTTLNLTFGDTVTTLQAGTPYIIKWAKASDYVDDDAHNIISPVFSGVTIDATDRSYDNGQTGNDCVRFLGTYDAKSFTAADENSILLMGANNTLRYAGEGASLGACRAYFKIGVDGASQTRSITSFSIDFGDGEGETTGIVTVSKESEGKGASEGWYTLDGRRLPAKPTRAGVYINNGNKVVVK